MNLIKAFFLIFLAGMAVIPFLKGKRQWSVLYMVVLMLTGISGIMAWQALTGEAREWILPGNVVTGAIPLRLDALSAWFILIINFVFITGGLYGLFYLKSPSLTLPTAGGILKPFLIQRNNLSLHSFAFLLLYASLVSLCVIQNSLVFLIAWEIMTLAAFLSVIFENEKEDTIKAGINFLIQSHVSVLFLMSGFIFAAAKTGSYDFTAITSLVTGPSTATALLLLFCFFIGFGIKAGFVPFHTWLPYAHPAAPAHISGIMSGVIIKIGIFGILRMLLLIPADYTAAGYLLLTISLISGLYGVMLAIVQHNLKKLLAYHSVENIGIIGLGIGIGCIGLGMDDQMIATLGFAGALLHTLNHALFKSLLFYASGIVYQATHTMNMEHLGGLIKKMPQTAALFLVAAIAISGIPPFNGFISEFIIYTGLYQWILNASLVPSMVALFMILGLVLIGGLALLCFTKAFGIVFLGTPRQVFHHELHEPPAGQLLPLYLTGFLIVGIGLFPQPFVQLIMSPVGLFTGISGSASPVVFHDVSGIMQSISWSVWGLVLLTLVFWGIRKLFIPSSKSEIVHPKSEIVPTWGCGYVGSSSKMQYTASSFVRSYRKLNSPTLLIFQHKKEINGIFPTEGHYDSHAYDKLEKWLIDKPVKALKSFLGRFLFLQNGRLQSYLLYGILFIIMLIFLPLIFNKIVQFFDFLKPL